MSLVLDEFYQQVPQLGVSSTLGKGFDQLLPKTEELKKEYFEVFLPELMGSDFKKPDENAEKEKVVKTEEEKQASNDNMEEAKAEANGDG